MKSSMLFRINLTAIILLSTPLSAEVLDEISIVEREDRAARQPGSAQVITSEQLERFEFADVQQILRQVPGVSLQLEDGYGLRPNIGIRGTATERSSRVTLLEDNILIAPAPYSAPSAYYFPTAGRMARVEVLKGSAAIRQGPYTVGGAINLISTPIPEHRAGEIQLELGSDATARGHLQLGDQGERLGWLIEAHRWQSDGFQSVRLGDADTGLTKNDLTAKLSYVLSQGERWSQNLSLKLQFADESSDQSYLGLTDADFAADPLSRYAASALDNIDTEHQQFVARYAIEDDIHRIGITLYRNEHERDWFKTEGLDPDGSASAAEFDRSSWANVISAINRDGTIEGLDATSLQALLDGGDSAVGAMQLRNNARVYLSEGIQLDYAGSFEFGTIRHDIRAGLRYHEDEEDRLQQNATYTQTNNALVLADAGVLGNAGNRLQQAEAVSFFIEDTIVLGRLELRPGLRYEDIDQSRIRWETRAGQTADPSSRASGNVRDIRENKTDTWIPGLGFSFELNQNAMLYGGVHKGFTAPTNAAGVDPEESRNYEFGVRGEFAGLRYDVAGFLTDYDNLLGVCTASSGNDCEIGDAFNGDAATIAGVELSASYGWTLSNGWTIPVELAATVLDAEFDSDIADTDFFGDVTAGDRLPYVAERQANLSVGLVASRWRTFLNLNHTGDTCVRATCLSDERSESFTLLDLSAHYDMTDALSAYTRIDNVFDEIALVARQPYGARPLRDRQYSVGMHYRFN